MRLRALLLVLLAGGFTAAGAVTVDVGAVPGHDTVERTIALARADLADVPAPSALSRTRDGAEHQHDTRRDVAVALFLAFGLSLLGGWWITRSTFPATRPRLVSARRRTRAPPVVPITVHC
jgi:hypothetical protein